MNDPVLARLRELSPTAPKPELATRIQRLAHARLRARPVHPAWIGAIAATALFYLGWALHFARALY